MSVPTENLDANGHPLAVGNGCVIAGTVTAVANGVATILLTDAYLPESVSVSVNCYNVRQQKLKS